MKRVSTVLLGTLALLLLPVALQAADGELGADRVAASDPVEAVVTLTERGFWHTLPDNPHPDAATWTPDPSLERVDERSETTKIFGDAEDPLKRTAVIGIGAIHYPGPDGRWLDIATDLVRKSGGVLAATANRFQTFLPDRLRAGHMAEIQSEGHWIRFGEGLGLSYEASDGARRRVAARTDGARAEVQGNLAIYRGALGGDLIQRVGRVWVEQNLLLQSAPSEISDDPNGSLVLRETVRFSEGLVAYVDSEEVGDRPIWGKEVYLVEPRTETTIFRLVIPTAFETDALAERHLGDEDLVGEYRVTRDGDALVVEKVFPGAWFVAPERQYPIALDPTVEPRVRTQNVQFHTGFIYRCSSCTISQYERVYDPVAPDYAAVGGRFRIYTNGAANQMKGWLRFDISTLERYITTVNWATMRIWLDSANSWPSNHGVMNFNDVNLDVCAGNDGADAKARAQTVYNTIDSGSIFLSSGMGGTSGTHCGYGASGIDCMAPHWHLIDLCGNATTRIKGNRAGNLTYFNVGMELTSDSLLQDLRFQDRHHGNYPTVVINYTVACRSSADCEDSIPCTTNTCNSGRCEFPMTAGYCRISGTCYSQNYVNPNNPCQKCNPAASTSAWSNDNALACSDSNPCTHTDHCSNGSCVGTSYTCNDGKSCTTDTCDGDGTCTYTVNGGWCLIGGTCFTRGTANPAEPCQECHDEWGVHYKTNWAYDNANSCTDNDACTKQDHCAGGICSSTSYSCNDGKACTQDVCRGDGTCDHNILAGTCFISNVCYNDEQTSPFNDCKKCDANVSRTGWTNWPAGRTCADDGFGCTADKCSGTGSCLHTINSGKCLISSVCYSTGDDRPTDPCHECNAALSQTAWSNVPNNTVNRACYPCTGGAHNIGICHNGIQWCTNGAWGNCSGQQCPETDVCDSLDNDCDGNTDENYPTLGNSCDGGDYDACSTGTLTCRENGSAVECVNDGAIAFFKFDEGTGSQVHTSSGIVTTPYRTPPRVGTISGASWTASGRSGKALIFDGIDDYVDIPHHTTMDLTTGVTMEAWIYPTAATGEWRVIGGLFNGGNGGYYIAVNYTQGPGFSGWFGSCGWKYSNVLPPLNKWTHVAATYNGTTVKLFVDGAKSYEGACSNPLAVSTSPMHIGGLGAYNPVQAPFAGAIDDFGVYKTALSEAQVKARARDGDHCDGADNDCDGLIDEALYPDFNTAGIDPSRAGRIANKFSDCDGTDSDWCINGTYSCAANGLSIVCTNEDPLNVVEICNGLDDDCNQILPANENDVDNDGFMVCEGDCDDTSTNFNPAHPEVCDGFDNNCDNVLPVAEQDLDNDLHRACIPGQLYSNGGPLDWADCDDSNPAIHKDAPEVCDLLDNDCDGLIDSADPNVLGPSVDSYTPIGVPAGDPTVGPRTVDVTFYGKNFVPGAPNTTIDFGYGVTVNSITVTSTQLMVVNITVEVQTAANVNQLVKARDIVFNMGNCPLTIPKGFDVYRYNEVPSLTQWGVIALGALLLGLGIVAIRRRRFGHLSV